MTSITCRLNKQQQPVVLAVTLAADFVVVATGNEEAVVDVAAAVVVVVVEVLLVARSSDLQREVIVSSSPDLEKCSTPVFESLVLSTPLFNSQVVPCLSETSWRWRACLISCCSWVWRSDRDANKLLQSSSSSSSATCLSCASGSCEDDRELDWVIAARQRSIMETSRDVLWVFRGLSGLSESTEFLLDLSLLSESLEIRRDSSNAQASLLSLWESTETSWDFSHTSLSLHSLSESTPDEAASLCCWFFRNVFSLSIQHKTQITIYTKQGVALTGRNTTGPLRAAPWWVTLCHVELQMPTDDDRCMLSQTILVLEVERRSLAGKFSLSCVQPVADGWPFMWVNSPLLVNQPSQLRLSSLQGW